MFTAYNFEKKEDTCNLNYLFESRTTIMTSAGFDHQFLTLLLKFILCHYTCTLIFIYQNRILMVKINS